MKAVGLRTVPEDGRIVSVDLDGETAVDKVCEYGLNPFQGTFIVGRRGDTYRLKLQFQLTPEQAAEIGPFQGKTHTKPAGNGTKGEAVEVFATARRQVIVGGRHPSCENYIWFDSCGPEALAAPDARWWEFIKECYSRAQQPPDRQPPAIRAGQTLAPFAVGMTALVAQTSGVNSAKPGCRSACLGSHSMRQKDSASAMSTTAGH